jgi:hypothetical protein
MLMAISAHKTEIDADVIRAAIEIAKWQLAVREEVMPIDAYNAIAAMEQKIVRKLRARGPLGEKKLRDLTNAYRAGYGSSTPPSRMSWRPNWPVSTPEGGLCNPGLKFRAPPARRCHSRCHPQNGGLLQIRSARSQILLRVEVAIATSGLSHF